MDGLSLVSLQSTFGLAWPYVIVAVVGFLPTEIWRVLGVFVGNDLNENSEIFHWVRMVAAALVTAVVAKLLLSANGALASLPLWGRLFALMFGLTVMMLMKRSILWGLVAGEGAIVIIGVLTS